MTLFSIEELKQACELVHQHMQPTPQYQWPLINEAVGTKVWVKHENHTPTGAFKIRGGITFMNWLKQAHPQCKGVISATRGNHGQSQARAATAAGLTSIMVVPKGNSKEKNEAMRAFGAELIEFGDDFDQAKAETLRLSSEKNLFMVPPFHEQLVLGVATYAYELMTAVQHLDVIYVPIGCGSGICGLITVRDLLGLSTQIVGVVSEAAQTAKLSYESQTLVETASANTFADGMAVRVPVKQAFDIYSKGASSIISVSDVEIANAMRCYYTATHNVAEGSGAAALAAALQQKQQLKGKHVGLILSGGNIDSELFIEVLKGNTPKPF